MVGFDQVATGAGGVNRPEWTYNFGFNCQGCQLPKVTFDQKRQSAFVLSVEGFDEGNIHYYVPVEGYFSFSIGQGSNTVHVRSDVYVDLGDIQRKFMSLVSSQLNSGDDCHELLIVNNASIEQSGSNASAHANATFEKWYCTSATLPQVRCEDTWIRIGPMKTKGIPKCTTFSGTVQTTKNKLVQQSGDVYITLRPVLNGPAAVSVQAQVDRVHLDGFGEQIASFFKLNLKNMAQNLLDKSLNSGALSFSAPDELKDYVQFQTVEFENDGVNLKMRAHGILTYAARR